MVVLKGLREEAAGAPGRESGGGAGGQEDPKGADGHRRVATEDLPAEPRRRQWH